MSKTVNTHRADRHTAHLSVLCVSYHQFSDNVLSTISLSVLATEDYLVESTWACVPVLPGHLADFVLTPHKAHVHTLGVWTTSHFLWHHFRTDRITQNETNGNRFFRGWMSSQHHQSTNGHSKPVAYPGFHFVGINLNKFQLVIYDISKKCRYAGINALLARLQSHTDIY